MLINFHSLVEFVAYKNKKQKNNSILFWLLNMFFDSFRIQSKFNGNLMQHSMKMCKYFAQNEKEIEKKIYKCVGTWFYNSNIEAHLPFWYRLSLQYFLQINWFEL